MFRQVVVPVKRLFDKKSPETPFVRVCVCVCFFFLQFFLCLLFFRRSEVEKRLLTNPTRSLNLAENKGVHFEVIFKTTGYNISNISVEILNKTFDCEKQRDLCGGKKCCGKWTQTSSRHYFIASSCHHVITSSRHLLHQSNASQKSFTSLSPALFCAKHCFKLIGLTC